MKGDDIDCDDTMHVTMNKLDDSDDDSCSPQCYNQPMKIMVARQWL